MLGEAVMALMTHAWTGARGALVAAVGHSHNPSLVDASPTRPHIFPFGLPLAGRGSTALSLFAASHSYSTCADSVAPAGSSRRPEYMPAPGRFLPWIRRRDRQTRRTDETLYPLLRETLSTINNQVRRLDPTLRPMCLTTRPLPGSSAGVRGHPGPPPDLVRTPEVEQLLLCAPVRLQSGGTAPAVAVPARRELVAGLVVQGGDADEQGAGAGLEERGDQSQGVVAGEVDVRHRLRPPSAAARAQHHFRVVATAPHQLRGVETRSREH